MKTYIIHGSPLSGKSTYVENVVGDNDLVFDYDKVMSALSLKDEHIHNDNLMDYILDIRSLILSKLKSEDKIDNVYIITTKVSEEFKESLIGLNPIYKKMEITVDEAKQRLKDNPGSRDQDVWYEVLDRYYTGESTVSTFHGSKAWKRKRELIKKRDGYLCKECMRYGKRIDGVAVHHIYPLEVRPDLKLNDNNLITLCNKHHEGMHDKFRDELSKVGKDLLKRTTNKYPDLIDRRYEM